MLPNKMVDVKTLKQTCLAETLHCFIDIRWWIWYNSEYILRKGKVDLIILYEIIGFGKWKYASDWKKNTTKEFIRCS